jgi:hypothetical protein
MVVRENMDKIKIEFATLLFFVCVCYFQIVKVNPFLNKNL